MNIHVTQPTPATQLAPAAKNEISVAFRNMEPLDLLAVYDAAQLAAEVWLGISNRPNIENDSGAEFCQEEMDRCFGIAEQVVEIALYRMPEGKQAARARFEILCRQASQVDNPELNREAAALLLAAAAGR